MDIDPPREGTGVCGASEQGMQSLLAIHNACDEAPSSLVGTHLNGLRIADYDRGTRELEGRQR